MNNQIIGAVVGAAVGFFLTSSKNDANTKKEGVPPAEKPKAEKPKPKPESE